MLFSMLFWVFIPKQVHAFLPRECLCAVNPYVLESAGDYGPSDPFFQCGAHSHGFKWCDVMDPASCKKSWDCDPDCDDPNECNEEYIAKTCQKGGKSDGKVQDEAFPGDDAYPGDNSEVASAGVHSGVAPSGVALYDLYGKDFHDGIFWKFCTGYRCRPFKSSPYDPDVLQQLSISEVEDWPDCCELCTKANKCLTWKFTHDKTFSRSQCSLFKVSSQRPNPAHKGVQPFTDYPKPDGTSYVAWKSMSITMSYASWKLGRSDTLLEIWGARGYNDMPVTCGRNGQGICHPDLWIWASFAISCGIIQLFILKAFSTRIKQRLQLLKFLKSEHLYHTNGLLFGLEKWESSHTSTNKDGSMSTSYVTRFRARLQYTDAAGENHRVDFSSKESKLHEGGVSYDADLAAKPFKSGSESASKRGSGLTTGTLTIPVIVDTREPDNFITGARLHGCFKILLFLNSFFGFGFALAAALIKITKGGPNGDQKAMDYTAIDFGARDAALEIPGVAQWEDNFVECYDGTNWAAFYTDTGEKLAVPFLVLAIVVYFGAVIIGIIFFGNTKSVQKQIEEKCKYAAPPGSPRDTETPVSEYETAVEPAP